MEGSEGTVITPIHASPLSQNMCIKPTELATAPPVTTAGSDPATTADSAQLSDIAYCSIVRPGASSCAVADMKAATGYSGW